MAHERLNSAQILNEMADAQLFGGQRLDDLPPQWFAQRLDQATRSTSTLIDIDPG